MVRNKQRMTTKEKAIATKALKEAIDAAGGTQAALARVLKCSRANVSQFIESGSVSFAVAKVIEDKLGVPRTRTLPNIYG